MKAIGRVFRKYRSAEEPLYVQVPHFGEGWWLDAEFSPEAPSKQISATLKEQVPWSVYSSRFVSAGYLVSCFEKHPLGTIQVS